ncbi:hypothetical protein [Chamaesiphon sp.]|uniref:hypothetical protein n=1 Tax=Chamaesiphon sp. TaxID=2814140 RepID=UPI003594535B
MSTLKRVFATEFLQLLIKLSRKGRVRSIVYLLDEIADYDLQNNSSLKCHLDRSCCQKVREYLQIQRSDRI